MMAETVRDFQPSPVGSGQTASSQAMRCGGTERSDRPSDLYVTRLRLVSLPIGSNISMRLCAPSCTRIRFQCMLPMFQKNSSGRLALPYCGGV